MKASAVVKGAAEEVGWAAMVVVGKVGWGWVVEGWVAVAPAGRG